jgi:hypothetical protein
MQSKDNFAAFEFMCRERAAIAKKEMEYWKGRGALVPSIAELKISANFSAAFN